MVQCGLPGARPAPWAWWVVEWLPWIGRRTRQHRRRQGPKKGRPSSQRGCVIWSAWHGRLSRAGLIVSFLPWPHAILNLWARQERGADGREMAVLVPPLCIQSKQVVECTKVVKNAVLVPPPQCVAKKPKGRHARVYFYLGESTRFWLLK